MVSAANHRTDNPIVFLSVLVLLTLLFSGGVPNAGTGSGLYSERSSISTTYDATVAGTGSYSEDFLTTTCCDLTATNASGWGVGSVSLPHKSPVLLGNCDTPDEANGVWVDGGIAYVADYDAGMQVINVTDPRSPTSLSSYINNTTICEVWVDGHIAYIADRGYGIQIVNVTDPRSPALLGNYNTGDAYDLWVDGSIAYVCDGQSGLQILNVTNPRSPTYVGSYDTPGFAYGVWQSGDYAYVADSGAGLTVLEVQHSRCRQFEGQAQAQSLAVSTVSGSASLVRATLTCTATLPTGTAIAYYLSPDDGTHWESVSPGVEHVFTNVGSILRWRAVLTTGDVVRTPSLTSLAITYRTRLNAPSLVLPTDGAITFDNTPTIEWGSMMDAANYLIQLDTVSTFNSTNLRNVTVPGNTTSYTPLLPLAYSTWYWRVAAIDSAGDLGYFASPRSILVQTQTTTTTTRPIGIPTIPPELLLEIGAAGIVVVVVAMVLLRRKGKAIGT